MQPSDAKRDSKLFQRVMGTLNEAQRRWLVGREALRGGRGGIQRMVEASGLSKPTILKGIRELAGKGKRDGDTPPVEAATPATDDAWLGHAEIARRVGVDPENLRKRLDRFRKTNHDCYREVAEGERKSTEPKYLYRMSLVKPVIDEMKTPNGAHA